jgi:hypothetical protein
LIQYNPSNTTTVAKTNQIVLFGAVGGGGSVLRLRGGVVVTDGNERGAALAATACDKGGLGFGMLA